MTYKLIVTYSGGNVQEHPGLSAEQAQTGWGAFLRDLLNLRGAGVVSVTVEAEGTR